MKKITLLAVVALAVAFTSCKKDRTCKCTQTPVSDTVNGTADPNYASSGTTTTETKMTKVKKSAASANCTSGDRTITGSYTFGGTTNTEVIVDKWDCSLS
jgi:hypothetical protein